MPLRGPRLCTTTPPSSRRRAPLLQRMRAERSSTHPRNLARDNTATRHSPRSSVSVQATTRQSPTCGGDEFDFATPLWLNAPMQLGHWMTVKGGAPGALGSPTGFFEAVTTSIAGVAFPMIYVNGQASTNDWLANFLITCNQPYQTCLYEDESSNGDGATDFRYD